ncbi:flavin monoamine oxidase family protein [Microbacterium gorillae]|uniref:flavin monoamine oxidase family protein n=1 Tax=Microbacterium gorillae TaxID=1231063 RepID=UPI000590089D|nr:FAD-dependent oxidoreductase [Microbacterium gorillae]
MTKQRLQTDVVVLGAGLSGLTAARSLQQHGVEDVLIVDARDRVGGRITTVPRPGGGTFEAGAEFIEAAFVEVPALAAELGVEIVSVDPVTGLQDVRFSGGERLLEAEPLAAQPELMDELGPVYEALAEIAASLDPVHPWETPTARDLDRITLAAWLDGFELSPAAREVLETDYSFLAASPEEVSILYVAWFGSISHAETEEPAPMRLVAGGGPSAIIAALAGPLSERTLLDSPVLSVEHGDDGVTVHTADHTIDARAVVIAVHPNLLQRVSFTPTLPPARRRLQQRWLGGPGAKLFAVYPTPWWRERGLSGTATNTLGIASIMDMSVVGDGTEGILAGQIAGTSEAIVADTDLLADDERLKDAFREAIVAAFGEEPEEPTEVHVASWFNDVWSPGCATAPPPGAVSLLGPVLRQDIGRIVFAGAETGEPFCDWMEGAVLAGRRAGHAAARLVLRDAR